MKRLSAGSTLIASAVLWLVTSPSHADEGKSVQKLQEGNANKYREEPSTTNPYSSSFKISAFSSSYVDSSGKVASQSKVVGNATGNASVFGQASGYASSTVMRNGRTKTSSATSSAQLRIGGRYPSPPSEAASTVSVTKNGVQISRSSDANDLGTLTRLDVITRSEKIAVREHSGGPIEVKIQSRKRNAGDKVYSASNRDELKRKNPRLVRRIEAFERIVGTASATVDGKSGGAKGKAQLLKNPFQ